MTSADLVDDAASMGGLSADDDEIHEDVPMPSPASVKLENAGVGKPEFFPNHVLSLWVDPDSMRRHLTLAIWLPSGLQKDDYSFCVNPPGTAFEMTVKLPVYLSNPIAMHEYWLQRRGQADGMERYHPRICGFEQYVQKFRSAKTDAVFSHASIDLPARVEATFSLKANLQWQGSNIRVLFVDMRCMARGYGDEGETTTTLAAERGGTDAQTNTEPASATLERI